MRSADREAEVFVRVVSAPDVPRLVRRLRAASGLPVAALARAVREADPILVATLYRLDHDEVEASVRALLADLETLGVEFEIVCGEEVVTRQLLFNLFERWRQVCYDTEMESDVASDAPGEDALRWARGRGDGFERK